jgi:FkbM family methyltransferase
MSYTTFHGEVLGNLHTDAVLRDYFPDYTYKGVFIDVGAFEPIRISNSYHFEKNGWDVYCFEANTPSIPFLKEHRKNVFNYAIYNEDKASVKFNIVESNGWTAGFSAIELDEGIANTFKCDNKKITIIDVPQRCLNTLLKNELSNVTHIDILKIDIEGGELKCLQGLDFNTYKPTIILLENICKNKDINNFLYSKGYVLDKEFSYNEFYKLRA